MTISKRFAAVAAVAGLAMAGATATFAAPPQIGGTVLLYDTVYYSDATYLVEVGRNYGVCYGGINEPAWAGASEFTDGQTTRFYRQVVSGTCSGGGGTHN